MTGLVVWMMPAKFCFMIKYKFCLIIFRSLLIRIGLSNLEKSALTPLALSMNRFLAEI